MTANVIPFTSEPEQNAALPSVVRHLAEGGLIACPTETVYGFGCAPDPTPLRELAALKQRQPGRPFLMLVFAAEDIPDVVWSPAAKRLANAFWPGPLTLVLAAPDCELPEEVRGLGGSIAVRMTSHAGIRRLLKVWRRPLASTSANAPGDEPAASAAAILDGIAAFRTAGNIVILDGGVLPPSQPSTIVDCVAQPPYLRREGAIDRAQLERIVHDIDT
jgi:L-threonylcarbamoyladenylate synthase